jgi:hypothetical protein
VPKRRRPIVTHPETFAALVAVHCLTDFPLQGDFLAKAKNHLRPITSVPWPLALAAHASITGAGVWLVTGSLALGLAETCVHFLVDFLRNEGALTFAQDQALHVASRALWTWILP